MFFLKSKFFCLLEGFKNKNRTQNVAQLNKEIKLFKILNGNKSIKLIYFYKCIYMVNQFQCTLLVKWFEKK